MVDDRATEARSVGVRVGSVFRGRSPVMSTVQSTTLSPDHYLGSDCCTPANITSPFTYPPWRQPLARASLLSAGTH
ncbi:hypothetical protein RvY_18916 [Ramazzottius varieornatus]|uniref:Uncharacterized protein n=1 Tax=Ramazzottius varieornatus TaxID=947166 RepID=A0A1D1W8W7_RAMVA|nr:hypothetical protein RvY_18916 [Ramazzottius varieornatus]